MGKIKSEKRLFTQTFFFSPALNTPFQIPKIFSKTFPKIRKNGKKRRKIFGKISKKLFQNPLKDWKKKRKALKTGYTGIFTGIQGYLPVFEGILSFFGNPFKKFPKRFSASSILRRLFLFFFFGLSWSNNERQERTKTDKYFNKSAN